MEAEDNPKRMLKRSKYKTIEDLQKWVSVNQSKVQNLWKLKEKEKKFWKKGLCEKEVGWCRIQHRDFCDLDSDCKPWDPIPASSAVGMLSDIINMRFSSCLSINLLYPPSRHSLMALTFPGVSMAHKGTHWRHHQKYLKVLELYRFETAWEYTVLSTIHKDMKMIKCSTSRMWPFTSYSPYPHMKSIPGDMSDISCEELRYLKYTCSEDEYVEYEKLLEEDYKVMRDMLRRDKYTQCSEENVCYDADNIMMYLVKEVYISEDEQATHLA